MTPEESRNERTVAVALAAVFVFFGFVLITVGTVLHHKRARLFGGGERAEGVVVRFERIGRGPADQLEKKFIVPVVRFTTSNGESVTFRGSIAEPFWSDYRVGKGVSVVYDPEHPEAARIDTWAELWFAPFLLWLVGAGAILIPPFTVYRHLREQR
jgi:hypothetical protein